MSSNENIRIETLNDVTMQDVLLHLKNIFSLFKRKIGVLLLWLIIGNAFGFFYYYITPAKYLAKMTFVLEEEKSSGGGLAGAMGLASSLGLDFGSNGNSVFSSPNLIELMKSRMIIERSLLNPVEINKKSVSLADFYIHLNSESKLDTVLSVFFPVDARRGTFTKQQDSLLGSLYSKIISGKVFSIDQSDKKSSIITISTTHSNELFAKRFTEAIAKEVSEFYIDTKSKKARSNLDILQRQTDSIKAELNGAITSVAIANDNTFNLNSALLAPKAAGMKRQVDVQANTAILTQLVANLEMAKITVRKETPLIQVIDTPIMPLDVERVSMVKSMMVGGILLGFLSSLFFVFKYWRKGYLVHLKTQL